MKRDMPPIALTVGEPAGIGPDIILQLLQDTLTTPLIIFGDPDCLAARAKQLGLPSTLLTKQTQVQIKPVKLSTPCTPGKLDIQNAPSVIQSIELATQACLKKECRAMVTAPVHKGIINEADIPFTGHTEFLAILTQTKQTVMMLTTPQLKVALVTTHLPLSKVAKAITTKKLTRCIEIIDHDLKTYFHIASPKIAVCGLNPHAGENGYLGDEEIKIIIPTLKKLRENGYDVIGPLPADTAFIPHSHQNADVILAMYHDQGLPVIKTQDFSHAVNITLGLPILRTSVDHGVALDLAGTGKASPSSLKAALELAEYSS